MELKLGHALEMRQRMRMVIREICQTCGKEGGHKPFCPGEQLKLVLGLRKAIKCPDCKAHAVDLNSDDFYECRECRTVFSTGYNESERKNRRVLLDIPGYDDLVPAVVRSQPGRGDIPVDAQIDRWQKACDDFRAAHPVRRRKRQ